MSLYIDSHIHTSARTQDEMSAMKTAGIVAVIEPAYWRAELQTEGGTLRDYFNRLVGWERFRASQSDLCHYCTVGLNPKEANNPQMTEQALAALPAYAANEGVVAIGEIGFEDMTADEEKMFRLQLRLAKEHRLPVLVRTPQHHKKEATLLSMLICDEEGVPPHQVIVGHGNEDTVADILSRGYWAALSLCSVNGMSCDALIDTVARYGGERIMVNSAAEWGWGHPLAVPGIADLMMQRGIPTDMIHAVCYANALKAYGSSGRMTEADWMEAARDAVANSEQTELAEAPASSSEEDTPSVMVR
jgi:predicted metal-dependent TIM-barrel fold hydrolase